MDLKKKIKENRNKETFHYITFRKRQLKFIGLITRKEDLENLSLTGVTTTAMAV